MVSKIRSESSFSLFEAVIALFMMAVVGVLTLHMFTASSGLSARATNIDTAASIAANAIEELKISRGPNAILATELARNSQIAFGQGTFFAVDEPMPFAEFDFSNGFRLYKYFDESWEDAAQSEDAAFRLTLYLDSADETDEFAIPGLFSVSIYVWDLRTDSEEPIADFFTKVYFPKVGELI